MKFVRLLVLCMFVVPVLSATASENSVKPAPEHLASWTKELSEAQPEDAFVAVYDLGDKKLIWVAAKHSTLTDSLTFEIINDAYEVFDVDQVILEGFPYQRGPNPEWLFEWESEQTSRDGFQEGGEAVPTVRGARREGAIIWGGEPDDKDIFEGVIAQGYSPADLLGFYTLRSIPQWVRERKISGADDPKVRGLLETELAYNRSRLDLEDDVLSDFEAWTQWYLQVNGKPLGKEFDPEETGPLSDGPYGSNAVAAAISRARAEFLLERVSEHLNTGSTVMVVFGASHLILHRPALDHMLGSPCYYGNDLTQAFSKVNGDCR